MNVDALVFVHKCLQLQCPLGFLLWWVCNFLSYPFWLVFVWNLFRQGLKWLHLFASFVHMLRISFSIPKCYLSLRIKRVSWMQKDGFESTLLVCIFCWGIGIIDIESLQWAVLLIPFFFSGAATPPFDLLGWDYLFLVFSCEWLTSLGWCFLLVPSGGLYL